MLSLDQARDQILAATRLRPVEEVSLLDATGRAVAGDIVATRPLPAFDNSAMDGYAVRLADCQTGTVLPISGYLPAGSRPGDEIAPGTAVKIMTGAPVPPGTGAVIPFEETREAPEHITILGPVSEGDHIRRQGEDIRPGDVIIPEGTLLRPTEISLLASQGWAKVPVRRRPRVAVLSTGDELRDVQEAQHAWGVVDSNSWALAAAIQEAGAEPVMLGIARDDLDELQQKIRTGLEFDVLVTSAGVSAGDRDLVREVLAELGVAEHFWRVKVKPGKPTAFGTRGDTLVFSLPGNPVSALMIFEQLVRPALQKMTGHRSLQAPLLKATLKEPMKNRSGRLSLVRINLRQEGTALVAYNAGKQQTGILSTSLHANAVAFLPADREEYNAGDEVDVQLLSSFAFHSVPTGNE